MSNPRSANAAASVREQKLARVIDREVAPVWHDRFARMLMRELPNRVGTFVLDIHSGPGHTTAELLRRLDETSRVVALGHDPWLMQIAKTHIKSEWKRRVYFKAGDIDDVTEMADATYDLTVANLLLGEHVVDWKAALAELRRVTKPGGHVLATVPMFGTWDEVEDMFEELLRDEGMDSELATLQKLRRRRPKPEQIVKGLHELGFDGADWVLEHERFEMLFRSGREFLFAPVIEHGPLRLWKAILGRAEQPQALFWRFKEVIDTYYAGKMLSVGVVAGLIRLRVPGPGVAGSFSAGYWSRYPELARLWNTSVANPTAKPSKQTKPADEFLDLDLELDFGGDDDDDDATAASASASASASAGASDSGLLALADVPGASGELPAVSDAALDDNPFANLLDELDAADEGVAPFEPELAEPERPGITASRATLGSLAPKPEESTGSGVRPVVARAPAKPSSGPLPAKPTPLPAKPTTGSVAGPLPAKPTTGSVASPLPAKPTTGSVAGPLPAKPTTGSVASPLPAKPTTPTKPPTTGSVAGPAPTKPPTMGSVAGPAPTKPPTMGSVAGPAPTKPPTAGSVAGPAPTKPGPTTGSVAGPPPTKPTSASYVGPAPTKPGGPTTGSVVGPAPRPPPAVKPSAPVTKPEVEPDPFASLLADDVFDKLEEIDDLADADDDDDEDFADSFGRIEPDPDAGRSGSRKSPPPPPPPPRPKK